MGGKMGSRYVKAGKAAPSHVQPRQGLCIAIAGLRVVLCDNRSCVHRGRPWNPSAKRMVCLVKIAEGDLVESGRTVINLLHVTTIYYHIPSKRTSDWYIDTYFFHLIPRISRVIRC